MKNAYIFGFIFCFFCLSPMVGASETRAIDITTAAHYTHIQTNRNAVASLLIDVDVTFRNFWGLDAGLNFFADQFLLGIFDDTGPVGINLYLQTDSTRPRSLGVFGKSHQFFGNHSLHQLGAYYRKNSNYDDQFWNLGLYYDQQQITEEVSTRTSQNHLWENQIEQVTITSTFVFVAGGIDFRNRNSSILLSLDWGIGPVSLDFEGFQEQPFMGLGMGITATAGWQQRFSVRDKPSYFEFGISYKQISARNDQDGTRMQTDNGESQYVRFDSQSRYIWGYVEFKIRL